MFILIFIATLIGSAWAHELGHNVAAFTQGVLVIPTPLKEYTLQDQVEWRQEIWISLGGVATTIFLVVGIVTWYLLKERQHGDAILAGVFTAPAVYTFRFLIVGRGHDDVEWQAAQTAIGANTNGHFFDVTFVFLCLAGTVAWLIRRRGSLRVSSLLNLVALMVLGITLLATLQSFNNKLFDRFFPDTRVVHEPVLESK